MKSGRLLANPGRVDSLTLRKFTYTRPEHACGHMHSLRDAGRRQIDKGWGLRECETDHVMHCSHQPSPRMKKKREKNKMLEKENKENTNNNKKANKTP